VFVFEYQLLKKTQKGFKSIKNLPMIENKIVCILSWGKRGGKMRKKPRMPGAKRSLEEEKLMTNETWSHGKWGGIVRRSRDSGDRWEFASCKGLQGLDVQNFFGLFGHQVQESPASREGNMTFYTCPAVSYFNPDT